MKSSVKPARPFQRGQLVKSHLKPLETYRVISCGHAIAKVATIEGGYYEFRARVEILKAA